MTPEEKIEISQLLQVLLEFSKTHRMLSYLPEKTKYVEGLIKKLRDSAELDNFDISDITYKMIKERKVEKRFADSGADIELIPECKESWSKYYAIFEFVCEAGIDAGEYFDYGQCLSDIQEFIKDQFGPYARFIRYGEKLSPNPSGSEIIIHQYPNEIEIYRA